VSEIVGRNIFRFPVKSRQADVFYRKFRDFRVYWEVYNVFKNWLMSYIIIYQIK
jgi:hypothetical protein